MVSAILYGLFIALWYVFVVFPLLLLRLVTSVLHLIAFRLPMFVLFGGNEFTLSQTILYYILLCFFAVLIIFTIVIIKLYFASKNEQKRFEFKQSFKFALRSAILMVILPIIIYFLHLFVIVLYELLEKLLSLDGKNYDIASEIVKSIVPKFSTNIIKNVQTWKTQVAKSFHIEKKLWNNISQGYDALVLIEIFISASATLYIFLGLFLRITKSTFSQFSLFFTLPAHISLGVKDNGQSLRKWIAEYLKILIANFLIVLFLLIFSIYIKITNKASKDLTSYLASAAPETAGELLSALISIGLIVGGAFGFEQIVDNTIKIFNLEEYASKPAFRKKDKKQNTKKDITNNKTFHSNNKPSNTISKSSQSNKSINTIRNNKSSNSIKDNKSSNTFKPLLIKFTNMLENAKKKGT